MLVILLMAGCGGGESDQQAQAPAEPTLPPGIAAAPDGLLVHFDDTGSGDTALVFVHGWSCDRSYWDAQVEPLSKTYRVVRLDMGGHGESGTDRQAWNIPTFAQDVQAVVEKLDLQRVILVGHSMGGYVILEASKIMPDRVVGLIPVDSLHEIKGPISQEQVDAFLKDMRDDFPVGVETFVRGQMFTEDADPELVDRIAADMAAGNPEVGIGAIESFLDFDLVALLPQIEVPIHCINADKWPTDVDKGKELADSFEVTVMPGLGHFLHMEDPDAFNRNLDQVVLGFLANEEVEEEELEEPAA